MTDITSQGGEKQTYKFRRGFIRFLFFVPISQWFYTIPFYVSRFLTADQFHVAPRVLSRVRAKQSSRHYLVGGRRHRNGEFAAAGDANRRRRRIGRHEVGVDHAEHARLAELKYRNNETIMHTMGRLFLGRFCEQHVCTAKHVHSYGARLSEVCFYVLCTSIHQHIEHTVVCVELMTWIDVLLFLP